jgi:predicted DNA-binding helix-hairpin-helix protein
LIAGSVSFAQTDSSYLKTEELLEDILQNPVGEVDESDLYDILEQLMLNPINLNKASVDDLTRIPEVDVSDARLIINHRNKYGSFFSLNELNAIEDFNKELIKKITPFIYVEQKQIVDETKPEQFIANQ